MKKLSLLLWLALVIASAVPAAAQYSPAAQATGTTRSVLKQADQVEWADYHTTSIAGPAISGCPNAHVTCSTGVCYGYDNCCCRPHLLCCLKKIGRMLDCLLPCHKCCPNDCVFGACRPHLFDCGRCGGCRSGCAPSCSAPVGYPGASDPFIDDPLPPRPMPEPARDVRLRPTPAPSPYANRRSSPYKVTTASEVARQKDLEVTRRAVAPVAAPVTTPYRASDKFAAQPRTHSRPAPTAALVPAAAEEEIAPARRGADQAPAPPALLPVTIRRGSAELPVADLDIPVNPLRK
jgi:hypothetical protein